MLLAWLLLLSPALDAAWSLAEDAVARGDEAARARADEALSTLTAPPELVARAAWKRGWLAQRFARPAEARTHYRRCVELDASGRFAARARAALRVLDAVPPEEATLRARFEAVKRHPDPRAVERLLAEARTPETRAEMTEWLAHDALRARRLPRARELFLEALRLDPSRRGAARGALAAADDLASLAVVERALLAARVPRLADEARDLRLRVYAWWTAATSLALLALLFARARGWRAFRAAPLKAWRPWRATAFLLYAFGAGGLLAEAFEGDWLLPFLGCGLGAALVHLVAGAPRWSGASRGSAERVLSAIVAAVATLAACFAILAAFGRQSVVGL